VAASTTSPVGAQVVSHCWAASVMPTLITACAPANVSTHGGWPKTDDAVPASRSISQDSR
jgi:hypothetical protein